jgi:hypothetical protein
MSGITFFVSSSHLTRKGGVLRTVIDAIQDGGFRKFGAWPGACDRPEALAFLKKTGASVYLLKATLLSLKQLWKQLA